jgi:peptide/nickel transport system permease protein
LSRYLLRRLANTLIVMLGVIAVTFFLLRLTGDPVALMLPLDATPEAVAELRISLGLDAPLPVQFARYLYSVGQGNFGYSLRYRQPAFKLFRERFPATLELVVAAITVAVLVGLPLGILAAAYRGTTLDSLVMGGALLGQAIPGFYLGLMLILFLSVQLGLLPTGGRGSLAQLIMPTIVLSTYLIALIARMTRSSCLDTLSQDYIRTARAKGLGSRLVLFKHVLKPALIPVVTLIGLQVGTLFSGAVVTETVFSWPGIGRLAVEAISSRDFPVVQMVVVISSMIFVLTNVLVDVAYAFLDPRIRYD